jgi:hypothetical protein
MEKDHLGVNLNEDGIYYEKILRELKGINISKVDKEARSKIVN